MKVNVKIAPSAHDPSLSVPPPRLDRLRPLALRARYGVRELAPAFTRGSSLPRQEASLLQAKAAASRRAPYGAYVFILRGGEPRHGS